MQAWEKRGLYEVDALNYACALPRAHYRIRVQREPYRQDGMCSQRPRIHFTLLRNGLPVIQEVPYGDDCYGALGVSSMEVSERLKGNEMRLCFSIDYRHEAHCIDIGADYRQIGTRDGTEIYRHAPIGKDTFEELTAPFR